MTTTRNEMMGDGERQRTSFFLGASMALGWEIQMDDLFTLGKAPRSLAECLDMLEAMKTASRDRRVAVGLRVVSDRVEREALVKRLGK